MAINRDLLLKRIKSRMGELGLSMRALSLEANLKEDAVRDFFRGKTTIPRADNLEKIARVLGLSADFNLGAAADNTLSVRHAIASAASGLVMPLPPGAEFNLALPPSPHFQGHRLFGALMQGGKHRDFAEGSVLVFALREGKQALPVRPGHTVLVATQAAQPKRYMGAAEASKNRVSIRFRSSDYALDFGAHYCDLADLRGGELPAQGRNLAIEGVLIYSLRPEYAV